MRVSTIAYLLVWEASEGGVYYYLAGRWTALMVRCGLRDVPGGCGGLL